MTDTVVVREGATVTVVTQLAGAPATITPLADQVVEVVTDVKQGPPGPSGTDDFNLDLALIYQIAKL